MTSGILLMRQPKAALRLAAAGAKGSRVMDRWKLAAAVFVCAGALTNCEPVGRSGAQQLPRGKYLVENVGMCQDCHTPRDERGEFDRSKWLQGARMDAQPSHPVPNWNSDVPGIAGLPRLGDAAVIKLLETGVMPNGKQARPPMPQFRLTHEDAVAVADYLKSLPSAAK
jgi:mono/diheme cytochrome c family protein